MFLLNRRRVEGAYREAGLVEIETRSIGFFPPDPEPVYAGTAPRGESGEAARVGVDSANAGAERARGCGSQVGDMNDEEFRLLAEIEEHHWWFVGKRELLRALLESVPRGEHLLDLGCGTGGMLRELAGTGWSVGVDRSEFALRVCAKKGQRVLVRAGLDQLPFGGEAFDTILLLDVLEHLEDDVGFLRGVRGVCKREGRIVISVPAFQFLWSQHDETFEHRRRYSANSSRPWFERRGSFRNASATRTP